MPTKAGAKPKAHYSVVSPRQAFLLVSLPCPFPSPLCVFVAPISGLMSGCPWRRPEPSSGSRRQGFLSLSVRFLSSDRRSAYSHSSLALPATRPVVFTVRQAPGLGSGGEAWARRTLEDRLQAPWEPAGRDDRHRAGVNLPFLTLQFPEGHAASLARLKPWSPAGSERARGSRRTALWNT